MIRFCFCTISTLLLFVAAVRSDTHARDIILKNEKGDITVQGKLLKFDGKSYVIQSAHFGKMTVNSKKFTCAEGPCPKSAALKTTGTLTTNEFAIYGSNLLGSDLIPSLIDAYAQSTGATTKRIYTKDSQHLQIRVNNARGLNLASISIRTGGSKTSFPALAKGKAQIGMSSCPITGNELKLMARSGITGMTRPGREHIIALDGLQIILSPKNPVNALSIRQVAHIFSGKIKNWSEIGGPSGRINLRITGKKSGFYDMFHKLVLKPFKLKMSPEAKTYTSHMELSDSIARDPEAIGFTGLAYRRNTKAVAISTSCNSARYPSVFDIKTEEYPLSFRHYLYTTGKKAPPYAGKVLKFVLSAQAQGIIRKNGFVDLAPDYLAYSKQADRILTGVAATEHAFNVSLIDQFNRIFGNARRMSTTFRFRGTSLRLDNKSRMDAKHLGKLFMTKKFRKKKIYLVGFADANGSTDKNIIQALGRADKVRSAILSASGGRLAHKLNVRAYGELLPVSCNDTKMGRYKNRRVEVWIR